MRHLCRVVKVTHQHDVELWQTGFNRFAVTYGLQSKAGLDYADACFELGKCIMHALSCSGDVDNRTKKEAKEDGDSRPVFYS